MSLELYRTEGVLSLDTVSKFKIVFWGCGSLNSMAAYLICRYPFREIVFCDPGELKVHNIERHLLSARYLGTNKAAAMKLWAITERGLDDTKITAIQGPAQDHLKEQSDADIWIVGTDKFRVNEAINAAAVEYGIPCIYGGVYERGKGGNAIFLPDPSNVCFNCAQLYLTGGKPQTKDPESVNYGIDPTTLDSRDLVSVPALAHAVGTIAAEIANLTIGFMNGWVNGEQISIQSISEPVKFMVFSADNPILQAIVPFIGAQPGMGIVPMLRVAREPGTCTLILQGGIIRLVPTRHSECQLHSEGTFSLDDL